MKKVAVVSLAIAAVAGWILAANLNSHAHVTHGAGTITENDQRCPLCDGTGFGPNSQGEKGKGHYKCIRCNGTGKI